MALQTQTIDADPGVPRDIGRIGEFAGLSDGWYAGEGRPFDARGLDRISTRFADYPAALVQPAAFPSPYSDMGTLGEVVAQGGVVQIQFDCGNWFGNLEIDTATDTCVWMDWPVDASGTSDGVLTERTYALDDNNAWEWMLARLTDKSADGSPS